MTSPSPGSPVLWLRAASERNIVREHLRHVRGLFRASGWWVHEGRQPPSVAEVPGPIAVMDDMWTEPLPAAARHLAEAAAPGAPAWRLPQISGGSGAQGWTARYGPFTLAEYRKQVLRRARKTAKAVQPGAGPLWTGFAAAPAREARELLRMGWPPAAENTVLVSGVRLYRYGDPADHERLELDPFIPDRAKTILDVGCGHGRLGARLRRPGRRVIGIEPDPAMARAAAKRLDLVLRGTAEEMLPAVGAELDCVVFADVLEHTPDPAQILELTARRLSPDGRVVVSIPNSAWAPLLRDLTAGRWERTLAGVQARDHLVPLTPSSFAALAAEAGLAVERQVPLPAPLPLRLRLWAWLAARTAGGDPRHLSAPQWILVLRPAQRRAGSTGSAEEEASVAAGRD